MTLTLASRLTAVKVSRFYSHSTTTAATASVILYALARQISISEIGDDDDDGNEKRESDDFHKLQ